MGCTHGAYAALSSLCTASTPPAILRALMLHSASFASPHPRCCSKRLGRLFFMSNTRCAFTLLRISRTRRCCALSPPLLRRALSALPLPPRVPLLRAMAQHSAQTLTACLCCWEPADVYLRQTRCGLGAARCGIRCTAVLCSLTFLGIIDLRGIASRSALLRTFLFSLLSSGSLIGERRPPVFLASRH